MALSSINNANASHILNISTNTQAQNTSKLSSGFKINRDDTAATLSIKAGKNSKIEAENTESAMSSVKDIDKADEMVAKASQNILAQPEESVLAQANQASDGVINLVQ